MDIFTRRLNNELPEEYQEMIKHYDCWLAGGAVLSLVIGSEINDYDIYFKTKYDAFDFFEELGGLRWTTITSITNKSIVCHKYHSGKMIVFNLIIFKYFDKAQDIFDSFDFTCCKAAWTGKKFIYDPHFMADVASRLIVYTPSFRYPIASLLRVYKYQNKGFTISRNEMLKIIFMITQHPVDSLEALEEELGSIYGISLKKIYPEDEEFSVTRLIEVIENLPDDLFKLTQGSEKSIYSTEDLPQDFKDVEKEYFERTFEEHIPNSLEYEDEGLGFCIKVPVCPSDVDNEGRQLKHCVGSYIGNILKGKCKILFLRHIDKKDESLVTLEIKRGKLCTALGSMNRKITEKELEFLKEYCRVKNIRISI